MVPDYHGEHGEGGEREGKGEEGRGEARGEGEKKRRWRRRSSIPYQCV